MLDRNKSYLESFNFAFLGLSKLLETKITKSPKLVNLEVTKKCNARCDFCDYWQTQHEEKLDDYTDLIKKINPERRLIFEFENEPDEQFINDLTKEYNFNINQKVITANLPDSKLQKLLSILTKEYVSTP